MPDSTGVEEERQRLIDLALEDEGVVKAMREGSLQADGVGESVEISLDQNQSVNEKVSALFILRRAKERIERRRWLVRLLSVVADGAWEISVAILAAAIVIGLIFSQEERIRWYEGTAFTVFIGLMVIIVFNFIAYALRRGLAVARRERIQARQTFSELEHFTVEGTILPEVRALIKDPPFNTSLKPIDTRGLGSPFDPRYEVPVKATEDLGHVLDALEAGSVGIAGSRGVGKTTLIRAACGGGLGTGEADEPNVQHGVVVSAPVRYEAQDFVRFLFAELCLSVLSAPRPEGEAEAVGMPYGRYEGGRGVLAGLLAAAFFGQPRRPVDNSALGVEARRCLQRLRYLETLSHDWSGEVGAKGASIGMKRAISRAEQAWTLPELIKHYRRFLGLLAENGPVVIGIDELDKMSDVDEARSFLNDMKSLFDQPKVYYLVSISEDALTDFERRGQPVRDVFDSVFSDVLHVDFLGLEESNLILRRRAIGVPPPWPALFHCLSGGLPRESIRVARRAARIASESSAELDAVTIRLIAERARAHEHAATVIGQRHLGADGSQPLLSWLRNLPTIDPGVPPAGKTKLEVAQTALLARLDVKRVVLELRRHDRSEGGAADDLERVVMELAASWHHSLACLEFFAKLDEKGFVRACKARDDAPTDIELLALGHQDLSASPALSWQTVEEFRRRCGLELHAYPVVNSELNASSANDGRHSVVGATDGDALSVSDKPSA